GVPIHGGGVRVAGEGVGGADEHGRSRAVAGQRVRRAAVAEREVRRGVPVASCHGAGPPLGAAALLRLLQRGSSAPIAEGPDAGGGLPGAAKVADAVSALTDVAGDVKNAGYDAPRNCSEVMADICPNARFHLL